MSQRDRREFGVVPGSRLDAALKVLTRRERRSMLAIMSQRLPEGRTRPTRRQRKWAARMSRSILKRGVSL